MPTYQYACTVCDHRFDAVQSFSDASLTECPACAGMLRKVFSSVGIVFKGSGFYRTDSRAGAGSTVATGENGSKNGGDGAKSDAGKGDGAKSDNGKAEKKPSSESKKSDSGSSASASSGASKTAAST